MELKLIKLTELIAGKFDLKETTEILEKMFVTYKVKPKVVWNNDTKRYAHYDFDRNIMYVSKKLNKNTKTFLHTILHEIKHAVDTKKMGKKKFVLAYETEQNMIAQGYYKDKHDPYSDNKFEIAAEKFAKKQYGHWKKALSKSKQMRF